MSSISSMRTALILTLVSIAGSYTVNEPSKHYSNTVNFQSDSCGEAETQTIQELMKLTNCPECLNAKLNELSGEELQKLKIDIWKQQFLKKLGLKEAPCVNLPRPPLRPILAAVEGNKKEDVSQENDGYEKKNQEVAVFANQISENLPCSTSTQVTCSIQLQFVFPENIDLMKVVYVDLWIYKEVEFSENWITVEIANGPDLNEFLRQPEYVDKDYGNIMSGWLKSRLQMNLSSSILENPTVFNITLHGASLITRGEEKPFLILHFEKRNNLPNRNRRGLVCQEDSKTCCKESWLIDFATIGWDKWILHPVRYFANYCKGTCEHDISIHRYFHSAVKYTYLKFNKTAKETLGINVCCTPAKLSPLSMIYRDVNGTLYHNILPNMIVDSCDCP